MLRPAAHGRFDLHRFQRLGQLFDDLLHDVFAFGLAFLDHAHDLVELLRMKGGERQVLELPLDLVDAQPVRERGVDLQRLARLQLLGVARQVADRPHVMEPVRELDQQHTDVPRHGDDHLADRLGLVCLLGLERHLVQLGDAVDDVRGLFAELLLDLLDRQRRVFDHVVEEGGHDRRGVHVQVGQDARDLQGMLDEPLPRRTELVTVALGGVFVRALDQLEVGFGVGRLDGVK